MKTDATDPTHTLHLQLRRAGTSLADAGEPLKTVGGLGAALSVDGGHARLEVALAALTHAELRWGVDKVLRNLRGLFGVGAITVAADDGVDDDTLLTVALDLHHAASGEVTVEGRPAVASEVATVGAAEDLYRGWINEDPTHRTSLRIARDIKDWAGERDDVELEVIDEAAAHDRDLNLLLAVGQASQVSPPRLVLARYRPDEPAPLMLVGKGITFDSGGINVKPYESFVSMMKNDMGGAALAWALFKTLVEAGHGAPLALAIPTCENPVGERAMRPGSVVKSHRGPTVRIDHTDAEGRLILADALSYATEVYQPDQVICFATLTTAALIAYGPYATPVHFATGAFEQRLAAAADALGEDLHFFPSRIWHDEANTDREADLRNTARLPDHANKSAGSRNAAHFLKRFTDAPLTHFDIFASTWNWAGDAPGAGYGATGAPLRTVLRALRTAD